MEIKSGGKLPDGREAIYWTVACDECGKPLMSVADDISLKACRAEAKKVADGAGWILTSGYPGLSLPKCLCPDCESREE